MGVCVVFLARTRNDEEKASFKSKRLWRMMENQNQTQDNHRKSWGNLREFHQVLSICSQVTIQGL